MLRLITPAIRSASSDKVASTNARLTPRTPCMGLPVERTSHFVLDDLDAQASSLSTLQPNERPSELLILRCPMIRLDIRCPAPPNRRGTWGDGAHLRSGIVTLDLHGLTASVGEPSGVPSTKPTIRQRRTSQAGEATRRLDSNAAASVEWQKMILFFSRVPGEFGMYNRCLADNIRRENVFRLFSRWTSCS